MAELPPIEDPAELIPRSPETTPAADLAAAEALRPFDDLRLDDLVVEEQPPTPIAKSWAFDFPGGEFLFAGQHGPTPTWGRTTLRYWIEKCLRTPQGALPIHPPGYGVRGLTRMLARPSPEVIADMEPAVREALLFHPRISDVVDFKASHDPMQEYIEVSFRVVTDEEQVGVLDVERLILRGENG